MAMSGLRQTMYNQGATVTSTTTPNATTLAGSAFVAFISVFEASRIGATPVSDSNANTWVHVCGPFGSGNGFIDVWMCENDIGAVNHNFTFTPTSASFIAITVHEIVGCAAGALVAGSTGATVSAADHPTGNLTSVTAAGEIWLAGCSVSGTTVPIVKATNPRLWLETSNSNGSVTEGLITAIRMVESGVTAQATFTTSNRQEGAAICALKMAASGGAAAATVAHTFFG